MDPGLAGQPSSEPKRTEPALIDLSNLAGNANALSHHDGRASSSSSSSDTSDGDDFFQLDPLGHGHPMQPSPLDPPHSPRMLAQSNYNPFDASRSHGEDHNQTQPAEHRPSASPPLPPMVGRNDVPDPNRIPSSIFTRTKSNSPMEWSVASNESLFSIHMGNASFSRDNVFLAGRSGEMNSFTGSPYVRTGETNSFTGSGYDGYPTPPLSPISTFPASFPPPLSPLPPPVSPLPPIPPASSSTHPTAMAARHGPERPGVAETTNAEAVTEVMRPTSEERDSEREKYESDKERAGQDANQFTKSISRQSDGSTTSFQSFAFPILTGDGVISGSIKGGPEHQEMQAHPMQPELPEQQTPKLGDSQHSNTADAAPTAAADDKGWFSCFSCCCR